MFKQGVVDPSNRLSSWSSLQDCCPHWEGVSCNENNRVVGLDLESSNNSETLRGEINLSSLLSLDFLERLYLGDNDFERISMPSINNSVATHTHLLPNSSSKLLVLSLSYNIHLRIDNLHYFLSQLPSLTSLDLSGIHLPSATNWVQLLASLPLEILLLQDYISFNDLSGTLPKILGQNESYASNDGLEIFMSFNKFKGQLPRVSNVHVLDLSHNSFSGPLSSLLCHRSETDVHALQYLDLSNNYLTQELPDCWSNWTKLSDICLGNNQLVGQVPLAMGSSLQYLSALDLQNNGFSGDMPWTFHKCSSLVLINLEGNNFSGSIQIWMPQNVSVVKLRSNQFTGTIPPQLCTLSKLIVLDLANNKLSGSIPHCLSNIASFSSVLDESDLLLDVLSDLPLDEPYRGGEIPEYIGEMKDLESLDFSHNHLHGNIPRSMSSLSFLSVLNLSYNNFSGQIPLGTQLQGFDAWSYTGNLELCGPPLQKNCTPPEKPDIREQVEGDDDDDGFLKSLYLGMGVGFAVGFWVVCGSLFLNRPWRHTYFRFFDEIIKAKSVSDNECVPFDITIKNFLLVAALPEDEGRERGNEVRDGKASEQRDIKARGGGQGEEIQCEEEQHQVEAVEASVDNRGG
ncbi:hypothetical protein K1719_027566 [Acacia pycnantha]|nr:hypothetical protein K1719_027566 [Acacia pycnantha]